MKLHIGDQVLITAGKDKGQKGKIEKVLKKDWKVVVQGLNVYKKFRKGFGNQAGSVIEFSRPIPLGNLALICPKCLKPTRVSFVLDKEGNKFRICSKCKSEIKERAK